VTQAACLASIYTNARLTHETPTSLPLSPPRRAPWILPGAMLVITLICLAASEPWPGWSRLLYLVPYTFLGNSLAPLPYDGAVVYLGSHFSLLLVVSVAVAATLIIETWNMELLARLLARDGTRHFRNHRITQSMLHWYRKAPFCSLVATCVIPIVPHYPMRFLAVLAGYPLWKYQVSVVLGRGARYAGLATVGVLLPIPGSWIVVASLIALALAVRSARRMNRLEETPSGAPVALGDEA
jgi:membrane protein YqaA with SNARE-associated domain